MRISFHFFGIFQEHGSNFVYNFLRAHRPSLLFHNLSRPFPFPFPSFLSDLSLFLSACTVCSRQTVAIARTSSLRKSIAPKHVHEQGRLLAYSGTIFDNGIDLFIGKYVWTYTRGYWWNNRRGGEKFRSEQHHKLIELLLNVLNSSDLIKNKLRSTPFY